MKYTANKLLQNNRNFQISLERAKAKNYATIIIKSLCSYNI